MVLSWANMPLTRNCEWTTAVDLCQNQDRPQVLLCGSHPSRRVAAADSEESESDNLKLSSFLVELLQPAVVRGYHWQQAT